MFNFISPTISLNIEKWKYNKEYQVYVSNYGHFKDKKKKNLPYLVNTSGYLVVKTAAGLKACHRLVLLTWRPVLNAEEATVDHLDHNKRNNFLSNLEWVSFEENQKRAKEDLAQKKVENEIKGLIICGGKRKFRDIHEAAAWVIEHNNINVPNAAIVERRIFGAITNKTKYCNMNWKMIYLN